MKMKNPKISVGFGIEIISLIELVKYIFNIIYYYE